MDVHFESCETEKAKPVLPSFGKSPILSKFDPCEPLLTHPSENSLVKRHCLHDESHKERWMICVKFVFKIWWLEKSLIHLSSSNFL